MNRSGPHLGVPNALPELHDREHGDQALLRRVRDAAALALPSFGFDNEYTAKFCAGCGKPLSEAISPEPASGESRSVGAERRQLTVMSCDLVGSTALASRLDPEDLREVIGAFHKCVAETIDRYNGFIARYMGDGVLVYFGYPYAQEDDAESGKGWARGR